MRDARIEIRAANNRNLATSITIDWPLWIRIRIVLAIFLLGSHGDSARAENGSLAAQVEALLPEHVAAAVMAMDDGKTIFKQTWGTCSLDRTMPCTGATSFRLASVSKHFTAISVLLLVDQGVVELQDTLDKFFPGCPAYWGQITIHHLLSHTSGIPDYEKMIPVETTLQLSDQNALGLLLSTTESLFKPGTKFAYSNSGYVLLGLIVETAAERPFHQFLKSQVLDPVGMKDSVLFVEGLNTVSNRALGHERQSDGTWIVADQSITSALRGDGGIYSSLDDLERWLKALDERRLLSDSMYDEMFKSQIKTDRGDSHYGYGWFIDNYRGERRVMHGGSTRGFSLMLQRFPDRRAAVVILLNQESAPAVDEFRSKVIDLLLFNNSLDSANGE